MDLLLGIVIGAVMMAICFFAIRSIKRSHSNQKASAASSQHDNRSPMFESAEDRRQREKEARQDSAYRELLNKYAEASTRGEYETVKRTVNSNRSQISEEQFDWLIEMVDTALEELERNERIAAEMAPKLAQFRALKSSTDSDYVFAELHKIYVLEQEEDVIIQYSELEAHGDEDDMDWMTSTYDKLVIERLQMLIATAITGTPEDYEKVRALHGELLDHHYVSKDHEDINELMDDETKKAWNEMVVRFLREPHPYDDLYDYDYIEHSEYDELIKKAREGDLLSLHLVVLMMEDSDISDRLVEIMTEEFNEQIEQQKLALGFLPGRTSAPPKWRQAVDETTEQGRPGSSPEPPLITPKGVFIFHKMTLLIWARCA